MYFPKGNEMRTGEPTRTPAITTFISFTGYSNNNKSYLERLLRSSHRASSFTLCQVLTSFHAIGTVILDTQMRKTAKHGDT